MTPRPGENWHHHQSLFKMKAPWRNCGASVPARRPGAPRSPYPGSEQLPGASPERPETATLWRVLGGRRSRRVESWRLLPRAAAAVATVRSGLGNPRAAGGPARSRPEDAGQGRGLTAPLASPSGPIGRSLLTSANFWAPWAARGEPARAPHSAPGLGGLRCCWSRRLSIPLARRRPDGGAPHRPPALRSKLMPRLNPLAITHGHHRGFYLPV